MNNHETLEMRPARLPAGARKRVALAVEAAVFLTLAVILGALTFLVCLGLYVLTGAVT